MTYKYKCGKDIINVFVWSDDFHTDVAIYDSKAARSYERTIREDKDGKFSAGSINYLVYEKLKKYADIKIEE